MAQLNITLNQEEILQLLSTDHDQAFRELLKSSLNSILMAESTAQLKAEPYERSEERTDSRNGTRERDLKTRIGRITLTVPRHRNVPFKTLVFENYSRSEAALFVLWRYKCVLSTYGHFMQCSMFYRNLYSYCWCFITQLAYSTMLSYWMSRCGNYQGLSNKKSIITAFTKRN